MRCFVVSSTELDGRLDANYYQYHVSDVGHGVTTVPLAEMVVFAKEKWVKNSIYEDIFPYIEIGEIDTVTGDITNVEWVSVDKAPSRARMLVRNGDIIISTTRPHRGAIAKIYPEHDEYIASTGFAIIRDLKKKSLSKDFLFYVLRTDYVLNQMLQRSSGGNYPAITLQELKKVRIPVVDKESQHQVISIMDKAYEKKQRLEEKSDDLLSSIDRYILDQLSIDGSVSKARTTYTISSMSVAGKRLDPLYHSQEILGNIETLDCEHPNIGDVVKYIKTGFPAGKGSQELEKFDEAIIQIRPTNISDTRELIFEKNIYINKSVLTKKPKALLKKGEVLFNNTNSQDWVGKTVYFEEDGMFVCSNHVTRILTKPDEIDAYFLYCILNLYHGLKVFYSICTNWNNQSGVNAKLLASLPIPKPNMGKQKEIAKEVKAQTRKAANLRKRALDQLEQAKAQVEEILFRDVA
jgi:type I restriction enzyme S subunit